VTVRKKQNVIPMALETPTDPQKSDRDRDRERKGRSRSRSKSRSRSWSCDRRDRDRDYDYRSKDKQNYRSTEIGIPNRGTTVTYLSRMMTLILVRRKRMTKRIIGTHDSSTSGPGMKFSP